MGMMPKKKGIPYFNACQKGAEEAAKTLGDVDLTFEGPIEDKSEAQSAMLDTWVTRKFDAVAMACNDPDQISSSLARAREAGVTVVTYDADANPEASRRQYFVNQAGVEEIAQALVDEMAKQAGAAAKVAVVSSSSTAPNQAAWLKAMDAYRAKKYPKMQVVTTEYGEEDQVKSEQKTQSILKAYPDVKGLWGMTSVAFPGAARAVEKAGKKGQVAVVGLGTPNVMKEFVKGGVVKSVVLWSPVDLGYLTVCVARAVAKGELKPGATSLKAGRLGVKEIKGQQVMLGKPMIFTKDNIDKFDF
jgi:ABC-type sugar transport system substrate-binding protein